MGRADAPTNGLKPSGKKLYWRFFMIGDRYCSHSRAEFFAPRRPSDSIEPQMDWTVSAKFDRARIPVTALCAG